MTAREFMEIIGQEATEETLWLLGRYIGEDALYVEFPDAPVPGMHNMEFVAGFKEFLEFVAGFKEFLERHKK